MPSLPNIGDTGWGTTLNDYISALNTTVGTNGSTLASLNTYVSGLTIAGETFTPGGSSASMSAATLQTGLNTVTSTGTPWLSPYNVAGSISGSNDLHSDLALLAPLDAPSFTDLASFEGIQLGVATALTANTSLTTTSATVQPCNATSGAFTVTLPSTTSPGIVFVIKKTDASSNAVTVTCSGTSSIDGNSSIALYHGFFLVVESTTTAGTWNIIGGNAYVPNVSANDNSSMAASSFAANLKVAGSVIAVATSTGALDLSSYTALNQTFELAAATGNITFDASAKKPTPLTGVLSRWAVLFTQPATGGTYNYTFTVSNATWRTGTATAARTGAAAATLFEFAYDGTTTWVSAVAADIAALQAGKVSTPGAWTAYTPTLNFYSGSGTTVSGTARYQQIGKQVALEIDLTIGGTTGTAFSISLPVAAQVTEGFAGALAQRNYNGTWSVNAVYFTGAGALFAVCPVSATGSVAFGQSSNPFASGDVIRFTCVYEAA